MQCEFNFDLENFSRKNRSEKIVNETLSGDLRSHGQTKDSPIAFKLEKLSPRSKQIHEIAVRKAKTYLVSEAELLEAIIAVDLDRTYENFGLTKLTPYCVQILGLSEDVAAIFVRVARKSQQVPELKEAVVQGDIPVTKAKTIASVITKENQEAWIEKAKTLSKEKLEYEVAKASPSQVVREQVKPVGENRFRVVLEFTEEEMKLIRKCQDIVSRSHKKSATLKETYLAAILRLVEQRDPVKKAERAEMRKAKKADGYKAKGKQTEKAGGFKTKGKQTEQGDTKTTSEESKNSAVGSKVSSQASDRSRDRSHTPQPTRVKEESVHIRHQNSASANKNRKTHSLDAATVHTINLRDNGCCRALLPDGKECGNSRWIQYHHIVPRELGGTNAPDNLITLCSRHHQLWHRLIEKATRKWA